MNYPLSCVPFIILNMLSCYLGYLYISIFMFCFKLNCKLPGLHAARLLSICVAPSTMQLLYLFYAPSTIAVKVITNTLIIYVMLIYTNNIRCISNVSKCISSLFVFI